MCKADNSKTGVYACVEKEVMEGMPMVALRFIAGDDEKLIPTHLVIDNTSYEISNTTLREGISNVCNAAQEAVETAKTSILEMQAAHMKAAALLQEVYPAYDNNLDWADNFKAYLSQVKS